LFTLDSFKNTDGAQIMGYFFHSKSCTLGNFNINGASYLSGHHTFGTLQYIFQEPEICGDLGINYYKANVRLPVRFIYRLMLDMKTG
jgi:hypothetical protein